MTKCTYSFLFCGGDDDRVLDMYSCCSIAHAKRTLHIRYSNDMSSTDTSFFLFINESFNEGHVFKV